MRTINFSKNHLFLFPLLIISLLFLTTIGEAAKLRVRVTVQRANIRLKPDITSQIIAKAPIGTVLLSEGKEGKWYKVILPHDESGFVVSGYIHEGIVEVVEEIIEVPKEEKIEEKKPLELKEEKEVKIEQIPQVPRREPIKRYSFRAGLGITFPTGDWSDLFNLGIGLNVGNSFSLVRRPEFDLELLGNLEVHIFLRKSGYADINWTRYLISGDCRFSYKADPITVFAQGGLGLYLDVLEIIVWWWKETGSEFRIGPRIGGGVTFRNLEIMAMYHLVENNMVTIMGSVIYRF